MNVCDCDNLSEDDVRLSTVRKMAKVESQRPTPPSWIDKKFLEKALNNGDSDSKVRVDSITVVCANTDGLGYMSRLYRVVVTFRRDGNSSCHQLSLIVKCSITEDGGLADLGKEHQVFETESLLLCEVLPEVHRALRALDGEELGAVGPRCYLSGSQPVQFLVMDDLSSAGFRLSEAGRPLDRDHCSLVLQAFARLHAASAKLLKKNPEYRTRCALTEMTDFQKQYYEHMADKMFKAVAKEFRTTPGFERYAEKYENLATKMSRDHMTYWKSNTPRLNVFIHGDCWKNNYMFKYSGGKPTDVRIIDFQLSKVYGPVSDLVYFLYANASEDVHRHHMDDLLVEYHSSLVLLLRRLGMWEEAGAYTLQDFRSDMEAATTFGLFFSAMSCLVLTSEKYGADFKEFFANENYSGPVLENAFKNPYSMPCLKYLAPLFDKKGLL